MTTGSGLQGVGIEDFLAEFLAATSESPMTYEPREDSFMMLEVLAKFELQGLTVLDVGTGSGILAAYCAKRGAEVTASDIDVTAIEALKSLTGKLGVGMRLVACDLISKIPEQFDMIVFNPPYLPSRVIDDHTVNGGKQGVEVIDRFLGQVAPHLKENGSAVLLVSSINGPERLRRRHPQLSFKILREQSFFFERLYVLEVTKLTE